MLFKKNHLRKNVKTSKRNNYQVFQVLSILSLTEIPEQYCKEEVRLKLVHL